jgi:radical SAM superfamily enzyme YgiQ (UPF0313 family)
MWDNLMKVFFVDVNYPDVADYIHGRAITRNRRKIPLDLAYPASILEQNGFSVDIIEANINKYSTKKVRELIGDERPDITFVNTSPLDRWQCPYLDITPAINTIEAIKSGGTKTAVIGPHGTISPGWLFEKSDAVDFVVRGEPEYTCLELVKNVDNPENIEGLSYRERGNIKNNVNREPIKDLDSLPYPAYHLLDLKKYERGLMLTSRGCPYRCIFCFKEMYYGNRYRTRSPENVIGEIEYLLGEGLTRIYFQDLEFTVDNKRAEKICDMILEKGLNFRWACSARVDNVTEDLLKKMKKAGCAWINFGVESGSQKVLDISRKKIKKEDTKRIVKASKKLGLIRSHFSLFGLPGEDMETINEHLDFMIELGLPYGANLPIPYPGTELNVMGQKEAGKEIGWDNCKEYAGRIGTDVLDKLGEDNVLEISKLYFKKRYGRFYFLNPIFYITRGSTIWKYITKKTPLFKT